MWRFSDPDGPALALFAGIVPPTDHRRLTGGSTGGSRRSSGPRSEDETPVSGDEPGLEEGRGGGGGGGRGGGGIVERREGRQGAAVPLDQSTGALR